MTAEEICKKYALNRAENQSIQDKLDELSINLGEDYYRIFQSRGQYLADCKENKEFPSIWMGWEDFLGVLDDYEDFEMKVAKLLDKKSKIKQNLGVIRTQVARVGRDLLKQ